MHRTFLAKPRRILTPFPCTSLPQTFPRQRSAITYPSNPCCCCRLKRPLPLPAPRPPLHAQGTPADACCGRGAPSFFLILIHILGACNLPQKLICRGRKNLYRMNNPMTSRYTTKTTQNKLPNSDDCANRLSSPGIQKSIQERLLPLS